MTRYTPGLARAEKGLHLLGSTDQLVFTRPFTVKRNKTKGLLPLDWKRLMHRGGVSDRPWIARPMDRLSMSGMTKPRKLLRQGGDSGSWPMKL
jgi:hypothetical protein